MNYSEYIMSELVKAGVHHLFTVAGGGSMYLLDAAARSGLQIIPCLHEQGAALAAEAYAQYAGLGACLVTTGPGGTNALTGCAAAYLESTPVVFISGQVRTAHMSRGERQRGFQELPIGDIVYPLVKADYFDLGEARRGRPGPIWVDVSLDWQEAEYTHEPADDFEILPIPVNQVAETMRCLGYARKPVILVGNGVRLAGAEQAFLDMAEIIGAPVLTTWKTADFYDEAHPLWIGRPGLIGQRAANKAIQECDLLLSIGARLDYGTTAWRPENIAPKAMRIIVDVDGAELDKREEFADLIHVQADAGEFVRQLAGAIGHRNRGGYFQWLRQCQAWKYLLPVERDHPRSQPYNAYHAIEDICAQSLPSDVIIPSSSGAASEVTLQAWKVKRGQRIICTHSLGAMGCAIPAAVGAALASGRRVICIEGDGSFQMNAQELELIRRYKLPVKIYVLCNNGYASIRATQQAYFGRIVGADPESGLTMPSPARLAAAYGVEVEEIQVDPDGKTYPKVASRKLADGTIDTDPMDVMSPYLEAVTDED